MTNIADRRKLNRDDGRGHGGGRTEVRNQVRQRVAEPARCRHQPADDAANPRMAAPGQRPVVGERLGKPHRDAGADRRGESYDECIVAVVRGKGGGEQGRQCRHGPVHQARESGLHDLKHEQPSFRRSFRFARCWGQILLLQRLGPRVMLPLGRGKVAEQRADGGVADTFDRAFVETARLELHDLRLLAHSIEPERTVEPHRLARDEAFHVLATNQRDVLAETLAKDLNQPRAMRRLFLLHLVEHCRRRGERLAQSIGEVAVDAAVLFLERDREREDFRFGQIAEVSGHDHAIMVSVLLRFSRRKSQPKDGLLSATTRCCPSCKLKAPPIQELWVSYLNELGDRFPDVPPAVMLKADILRNGVRPISDITIGNRYYHQHDQKSQATAAPHRQGSVQLPDGSHVFVTANAKSPFALRVDQDGRVWLTLDRELSGNEEFVCEVTPSRQYEWTTKRTSRGTPLATV